MSIRTSLEQTGKRMIDALGADTGETDILDTLREEHDEVQDLLARLVRSQAPGERRSLVQKVKAALVPHTKAEEQVVYDPVLRLKDRQAQVDGSEGYVEHSLASATLLQLGKMDPDTPEFAATAKVLKELVDHHVAEEERNIWDQVKENFTGAQRDRMNRDFLAAKKKVKV